MGEQLWGCTEYEVFSEEVKSPSGMALSPSGLLLVADYDSGVLLTACVFGRVCLAVFVGSTRAETHPFMAMQVT